MIELILFDLDGTLTDSAPGITRCVQYALTYLGKPRYSPEELNCFLGPPLHCLLYTSNRRHEYHAGFCNGENQ